MTFRALIVDDEEPARRRLRRLLTENAGAGAETPVEVVGEAGDGLDALEQIAALKPDVVFLDITMPRLDGFGVAEALGADAPRVVFVTAHDDQALRAFEVSALDYLLKPVSGDRLRAALARLAATRPAPRETVVRAVAALRPGVQRLAIRCGARFVVFEPAAIVAVEARDDYAEIALGDRRLLADETLDALEARLPAADFLRIHRGALINLGHLRELVREGDRKYVAVMDDFAETRLAVSRERLPALKERLGLA